MLRQIISGAFGLILLFDVSNAEIRVDVLEPKASNCPDISTVLPAMIIDNVDNRELVSELVPSWSSDDSSRIIIGEGYISEKGRIHSLLVSKLTGGFMNFNVLRRKMNRLRFTPAQIDSNPVSVYVGFSIVATKSGGNLDVVIVMNKLRYVDDYGLYYSGPQRISSSFNRPRHSRTTVFDIGVNVNEDGIPVSLEYDIQKGHGSRFFDNVAAAMADACFIPGQVQGVPKGMLFIERFWSLH